MKFLISVVNWIFNLLSKKLVTENPVDVILKPVDEKPWFESLQSKLGMNEVLADGSVNPMVTMFFTFTSYHTKKNEAWCAGAMCWALETTGYSSPHDAGAMSFINYGKSSDYRTGAILLLEHQGGSHHVTCFSHWINEQSKIASCLGGNQNNQMCFKPYDLKVEKVLRVCWPVK